ncbi:coiled-coil domain-containing protein 86-like [Halichondria panicea]|uniref:coiled-coil domain-containing protein 86-like n=1 Tax=Halichondria panicea TaxID=6063 RepID=UPI00312B8FD6
MPSSVQAVKRPEGIQGKSKSRRIWREPGEKSGSIIAAPGMRSSWKRRLVERAERKAMKEREHDLKEGAKKEKEVRRKRIEDKRQRKLDNEKKGEIVQQITNSAKLKRLNKKQMRSIQKR